MSRTAARFTQADVARSIRAAKQAGASAVELRPDGTIGITLELAGKMGEVQGQSKSINAQGIPAGAEII